MNGDLSLSQSLGGLRIANPDEDALSSSTRSPAPPSSHSSGSTVTDRNASGGLLPSLSHEAFEGEGLGFNPESYDVQDIPTAPSKPGPPQASEAARLNHRQSMPFGYQAQQQYAAHPQVRQISQPDSSTRLVNSMYMQQNTSSGSSQGSYRFRDDIGSAEGSPSGLGRSGSHRIPVRDGSRAYRGQQISGGNGPLPPRRNSRRMRAPTTGSAGGYEGPYTGNAPLPQTAEEWKERGASVTAQQSTDAAGQTSTKIVKKGVKDFNFGRTLGEGSYSTVLAATDRQNMKEYAIKVLDKRHIIKEKKVKYVNIERDTLNRLTEHPGIVRLYYTFQDERSLYFVLDLASGGELLGVLKKMGSFDVDCTRFYGAQILDSIAYMHTRGIIHRDLKPENVLLDREMHVKITDFGTAKILPDPKTTGREMAGNPSDGAETDRANSFVGTAEYVSPELLRDKNACKASDLWAFGCIVYQLLAGRPPFKAANEYLTFQKILALDYAFPDGFPEIARDLVERLLVLEPSNRLPVEHIKNHQFFDGVQWGKTLWRQKAPRLKAYVPPPSEPIRLNGSNKSGGPSLPAAAAAAAMSPTIQTQQPIPLAVNRPQLRGVTDLPPPSQLDIDWSPVLTHNNERILKLGNLVVFNGPQPSSPGGVKHGESGGISSLAEKPKFSRFFSGNATKKRERLVLITSCARLVIAAAGGQEKKAKMEVNCLGSEVAWRSFVDAKGLTAWALDTKDKHLTFEDPRATTSDPAGSKFTTQEWIDSLGQARELALSMRSRVSSYSGDSMINSAISSPADSIGGDASFSGPGAFAGTGERHALRQTLRKGEGDEAVGSGGGGGAFKGRKRFSKRHSKGGLAAVF